MDQISNFIGFVLSGLGLISLIYGAFIFKKTLDRRHNEKVLEDIDKIRAKYDPSNLQSVVDRSNEDWAVRNNSGRK